MGPPVSAGVFSYLYAVIPAQAGIQHTRGRVEKTHVAADAAP
jgi:hypothetical protein